MTIVIVITVFNSYSQLPSNLKKGLIAYYPFTKTISDSSGNNNNGTITGTVTYVKDALGNDSSALVLGSERIAIPNFFNFKYTDSFTVSFWFQVTDNSNSGRLLSTECSEGNFRITSYGDGIYSFQFGSGDYYLYDTIQLNTWYYMSYVYNNRNVKLYKNSVLKTNVINNSSELLNYCSPFTIGAKASPSYDMWRGYIDELSVYNRPLDSDEVKQWYTRNNTSAPDTVNLHKGLIAYYPFTGNADDSSGNGYNGTPVGAILTTDRFGNQNSAYYFDGNSYINTSFLPPTGSKARTITGWYKTNKLTGAILCYGINSGSCVYAGGRFMVDLSNTRLRFDGVCSAVTTNISYDTLWHHFAITYDSSFSSGIPEIQDIKLYVDGTQVTDNELYFGNTPLSTLTNSNLFIGRSADNSDTRYFTGSIDDIFIYNRALSNNEIKALYNLKYGTLLSSDMISFTGYRSDKNTYLKWATSHITNTNRFDVQYSADGRNFISIGTVIVKNSRQSGIVQYSFISKENSSKNYYRLKVFKNDATYSYSKTIFILGENRSIIVYPNPVKDYVNLEITSDKAETFTITLSDVTGRKIIILNNKTIQGLNSFKIVTSGLSKGIYFVTINGNNYHNTLKILK